MDQEVLKLLLPLEELAKRGRAMVPALRLALLLMPAREVVAVDEGEGEGAGEPQRLRLRFLVHPRPRRPPSPRCGSRQVELRKAQMATPALKPLLR